LSSWHDENYEYTAQKHQIFGPPPQIQSFLADLKNDSRIFNLKTFDSQVYFIEKRLKKEIPSSYYHSNLFYPKPVFVDIYGWEIWELVSRDKEHLKNFLRGLRNIEKAEIKVEFFKTYRVRNTLKNINKRDNITKRTEGELDQRLEEQLKTGHIEGDQWFRDFHDWLVIAFNNPYNFKHSNSELALLTANRRKIFPFLKNRLQIHYGVGVGETEIEIVYWQMESNDLIEICGIDINGVFLELFLENLKNKQIEFPQAKIMFKGYNTTFQNTAAEDFDFENAESDKKIHICLGGTIGNFRNQEEIWRVFGGNAKKGDRLFLGLQLNTHLKEIFEQYKGNKYYPNFVLNYYDEKIVPSKIKWTLDEKSGIIRMSYKGIHVFRSRKYDLNQLVSEASRHGFSLLDKWIDEYKNSCLALFEKTK